MKVEIAELLVLSWLRHVQGCTVTQLSWKPSRSWQLSNEHVLRQEFERIRTLARDTIGVPIFRQGEFAQFVRQAEIDVLGVRFPHGSATAQVVFATPKVAEPIGTAIERHVADLEVVFADRASAGPRLRFRLIANGDFSDEILQPVLAMAGDVADTSELFLRAQQLTALCERPTRSQRAVRDGAAPTDRGEGIGTHVRATMDGLAASGRLGPEIVAELSGARYCKQRFNLGYPFLRPVDPAVDLPSQRRDHNGYARYWRRPVRIGDHQFLMCHEWFDRQRTAFDQWVRDLM